MPRYNDEWVIDRVLFDYVSGGSCACCGFQQFLPNGTSDLIRAVSDIDTDQANDEITALEKFHPWPLEIRNHVWSDRVKLRYKLKRRMTSYASFWRRLRDGGDACYEDWLRSKFRDGTIRRTAQLSRGELLEHVRTEYNVHPAFGVCLCAVTEQVANFALTKYPPDARENSELDFENQLVYDRRGGFTLRCLRDSIVLEQQSRVRRRQESAAKKDAGGEEKGSNDDHDHDHDHDDRMKALEDEFVRVWCNRLQSLGGPTLLHRGTGSGSVGNRKKGKKKDDAGGSDSDDDSDDDDDADGVDKNIKSKPSSSKAASSFQSDRRLLRLLIARYWADALQKKYENDVVAPEE